MNQELKKLERRARSMLVDKDIPAGKMELIRSLMSNNDISSEERYRTIIDLLKSCPDKQVTEKAEPRDLRTEKDEPVRKAAVRKKPSEENTSSSAPTETMYYYDYLLKKYRHLKFFRKRYLIHRDNRFGIGIRKRFIPTRRFLKVLGEIAEYQQKTLSRLTPLLMDMLKDPDIIDPTDYNYLRKVRAWLMDEPLGRQNLDGIKWMERHNFEREFKNYLINFFAFQRLGAEVREKMLLAVENMLRSRDDLVKEEINQKDSDPVKARKEKKNLQKEREIFNYMLLIRSFIHGEMIDDTTVAKHLRSFYGIQNSEQFYVMIAEVLVFQRPVNIGDIVQHYQIETPRVSSEKWDYSDDFLKKIGKDPESRRKREKENLKEKLAPYEIVYKMLKAEDRGARLLPHGVEVQGRLLDRKRSDPEDLLNNNFLAYLDGAMHYFRHAWFNLLDGTPVQLRDVARDEYESPLFSDEIFTDEVNTLERLLNAMHDFRTENPTMVVSNSEMTGIMTGQISTMNHVRELVTSAGNFFYNLASDLLFYYDQHRLWIHHGNRRVEKSEVRRPVRKSDYSDLTGGRPFAFFDCIITGFEEEPRLFEEIKGRKVLGTSFGEGVVSIIIAYAFQIAQLCRNESLQKDMGDRRELLSRIDQLS